MWLWTKQRFWRWFWLMGIIDDILVGGFKHLLFSIVYAYQLINIFQRGWNHQPVFNLRGHKTHNTCFDSSFSLLRYCISQILHVFLCFFQEWYPVTKKWKWLLPLKAIQNAPSQISFLWIFGKWCEIIGLSSLGDAYPNWPKTNSTDLTWCGELELYSNSPDISSTHVTFVHQT
jgi:hypothetical protein